jgi:hypothetical protein
VSDQHQSSASGTNWWQPNQPPAPASSGSPEAPSSQAEPPASGDPSAGWQQAPVWPQLNSPPRQGGPPAPTNPPTPPGGWPPTGPPTPPGGRPPTGPPTPPGGRPPTNPPTPGGQSDDPSRGWQATPATGQPATHDPSTGWQATPPGGQFGAPSPIWPPAGAPPRRPASRRRTGLFVGLGAAVLVLLVGCGVGGWLVLSRLQGDDKPASVQPPPWGVGACVYQSGGPTSVPPSLDPELRQVYELRKEYSTVGCDDPRATSNVTAMGVQVQVGTKRPTDDGCPDDTDAALLIRTIAGSAGQVVCVRFLTGPHPGDPGGGGGKVVVGDCVVVGSSEGARPRNDRVYEAPCAEDGWFGQVAATAPDAAGCPAGNTLSRVPLPAKPGVVLCLDQGDKGLIAKPGECLQLAQNYYLPPYRVACGTSRTSFRLDGFADAAGRCAGDARAVTATGYDRVLCGRFST